MRQIVANVQGNVRAFQRRCALSCGAVWLAIVLLVPLVVLTGPDALAAPIAFEAAVQGQVRTTSGVPIANAAVETATRTVRTNSNGQYSTTVTSEAGYIIVTRDAQTSSAMPQVLSRLDVTVTGTEINALVANIDVPVARRLTVNVTDANAPVAGASVRTNGSACILPSGPWRTTCSFVNGTGGFTDDTGAVLLLVPDTSQLVQGNLTVTAEKNAQTANSGPLEVSSDTALPLALEPLVAISGVVRDTDGTPIVDALIETANGEVQSDVNGRYSNFVSSTNGYVILRGSENTSPVTSNLSSRSSVTVTGSEVGPVAVDFSLPVLKSLTVAVDYRGSPYKGATVDTIQSDCQTPAGVWPTTCRFAGASGQTGVDGRVVLKVPSTTQLTGSGLTVTARAAPGSVSSSPLQFSEDYSIGLSLPHAFDPLMFQPLSSPARVFDTRPSQPQGLRSVSKEMIGGRTEGRIKFTDIPLVTPSVGVAGVSLNVTVTEATDSGYVTVYPCGQRPTASNLNYVAGETIPNAVVAPVSAQGEVCFYSLVPVHLVVDLNGWFASSSGFSPVNPYRVFDTRPGTDGLRSVPKTMITGGSELQVNMGLAWWVGAISLNVTVTNTSGAGFVAVYPCGERPTVSNLNFVAGETIPNLVIASVPWDGNICFYSSVATDLVVDLNAVLKR